MNNDYKPFFKIIYDDEFEKLQAEFKRLKEVERLANLIAQAHEQLPPEVKLPRPLGNMLINLRRVLGRE